MELGVAKGHERMGIVKQSPFVDSREYSLLELHSATT